MRTNKWPIVLKAVMLSVIAAMLCGGCGSMEEKRQQAQMRWDKNAAKVRYKVAKDHFQQGRYLESRNVVTECLKADQEFAKGHILAGKLYLIDNKDKQALEHLKTAVVLDDRLAEGWFWLGIVHEELENNSEALESYRRALELDGDNGEYVLAVGKMLVEAGLSDEAVSLYEERLSSLPSDEYSVMLATAELYMQSGRMDDAVRLYEQAILISGENAVVLEAAGYGYVAAERWEKAAMCFEKLAAKGDSDKRQTYLKVLAVCEMNAGRYTQAASRYDELLLSDRENADFWLDLGQAFLGAGASNNAFSCAQRALAIKPGWAEAIALKGSAQYLNSDYHGSIKTFEKLKDDKAHGGFAWLMIGRSYEKLGRDGRSEQAYERALEKNPDSQLAAVLTAK